MRYRKQKSITTQKKKWSNRPTDFALTCDNPEFGDRPIENRAIGSIVDLCVRTDSEADADTEERRES